MSLLRFDDIGLEFGDQLILRNAELAIEPGERICLIGRNGAGKSTTLKLIMGTLEADRGEIIAKDDLIVSQLEHSLSLMDHVPFQGQEDLALGATVGGHGRPVRPTTVRA